MSKKRKGGFGVSEELWEAVKPHVPARSNVHPCGGGRKPAEPRRVFEGIYFVWRTGSQWKALDATGIIAGSTAHGVFQRWVKGRGVRADVVCGAGKGGRVGETGLVVCEYRRMHDQGALGRGKKPGRIRRTGASRGPS